jgi:lipoprotein-releasing system permease protein
MVPIDFGIELMNAGDKRSYLEISVENEDQIDEVKHNLETVLGPQFLVQNADDQHADLVKILKLEKLFVFIALSFILLIASFNIYVSLNMLAVEKQKDLSILRAMGANDSLLGMIFIAVGCFIALTGGIIGLSIGIGVCVAQQTYGFVNMGITNALVDAYPVTIDFNDMVYISLVIVLITLLASIGPARKAMKIGALLMAE